MSHDEPGAADHSSVDWDVLFDPTQSNSGLSPGHDILLVLDLNFNKQPNIFLLLLKKNVNIIWSNFPII